MKKMWDRVEEIDEIPFKKLKKSDVTELIHYIVTLYEINDYQADQLGKALEELDSVRDRLQFYRNTTVPKIIQ